MKRDRVRAAASLAPSTYDAPKFVDDPPCECGNDVGDINPSLELPLVPGTAGMALPRKCIAMAVRAPATAVIRPLDLNTGIPASRITIQEGDYHVMVAPFGGSMQFDLEQHLLDSQQKELPGSFVTDVSYDDGDDPRAVVLRHVWGKLGYAVQPFAVQRSGNVVVRGQVAIVRLGTRYFQGSNVYRNLGACTILEQGKYARFLRTAEEMSVEFMSVNTSVQQRPS